MGKEGVSYAGRLGGRFAGGLGGHAIAVTLATFAYDTGLAAPVRTTIQNGILQLLQRLDAPNGGYLAGLEATSTIIRGGGDEQSLSWIVDQIGGRTPIVLVGIGDEDFQPAGDVFNVKGNIQVPIYVIVNSMRGRLERLQGDANSAANRAADPGVYVILEHVRQLLQGRKPGDAGISIKELRIAHDRQLWSDDSFEIWEQIYTCMVSYTGDENRDISLELLQLETYSRLATQLITDIALTETNTTVPQ